MPKPIKRRVQKKDLGEKEVILYERLRDYFQENRKTVGLALVLTVLVILLLAGFILYNRSLKEQASVLESEGYKLYHNLSRQDGRNEEKALREALEKFQEAYDKKSSPTRLLYIAYTQYRLGQNEDALKTLNRFVEKYSDNKALLPLAYFKIATIELEEGKKEEALKTLETIYNLKGSPFLKDLALYESARILEGMGRRDEATKKYELIAKDYPESPYFQLALSKIKQEKPEKEAEKKGKGEK